MLTWQSSEPCVVSASAPPPNVWAPSNDPRRPFKPLYFLSQAQQQGATIKEAPRGEWTTIMQSGKGNVDALRMKPSEWDLISVYNIKKKSGNALTMGRGATTSLMELAESAKAGEEAFAGGTLRKVQETWWEQGGAGKAVSRHPKLCLQVQPGPHPSKPAARFDTGPKVLWTCFFPQSRIRIHGGSFVIAIFCGFPAVKAPHSTHHLALMMDQVRFTGFVDPPIVRTPLLLAEATPPAWVRASVR